MTAIDASKTVLVLFCKRPDRGFGKQRLANDLGEEYAFKLASALLDCALEDAATWHGQLVIAPSSTADLVWARELTDTLVLQSQSVEVVAQTVGGLGERLLDIDTRLREQGAQKIIYMGSDAPALQPKHLNLAIQELCNHDVVLADALDGGVTLMASGCHWPDIVGLPWSTTRLGDELAAKCTAAGLSVRRIDGGSDVDTAEDVRKLTSLLRRDQRPARRALIKIVGKAIHVTQATSP